VTEIVVQVPEETAPVLRVSPEELCYRVRMAAAAKLFELGQLSSGAAARLASVPRTGFLSRLADYGVDQYCPDTGLLEETRARAAQTRWLHILQVASPMGDCAPAMLPMQGGSRSKPRFVVASPQGKDATRANG
jgi:predicted HTH domain antitoxin